METVLTIGADSSERDEDLFFARLRTRYEAAGFAFDAGPAEALLPGFLAGFRPDALATKPGRNIVIEVVRWHSEDEPSRLATLRKRFEGHPDWQLNVVLTDFGSDITISTPTLSAIKQRRREIADLLSEGHRSMAFVLGWTLLEAAYHAILGEPTSRPMDPAGVIQALAMDGIIEPDMERRIHSLAALRNRIVHGDLDATVDDSQVETVVAALDQALSLDAE